MPVLEVGRLVRVLTWAETAAAGGARAAAASRVSGRANRASGADRA